MQLTKVKKKGSVYGRDLVDTAFDDFIDTCDGGCGAGGGMSVDDFEKGMIDGKNANAEISCAAFTGETGACRRPRRATCYILDKF